MRSLIDELLVEALSVLRAAKVSIYTFALFYDHESPAISVCADTAEKSASTVAAMNAYNAKHFHAAVLNGDLNSASLWRANIGRSLSLGDFRLVNCVRRDLGSDFQASPSFFVSLVQALVAVEPAIAALSDDPVSLVFCCSGQNDEVEYWWSLGGQGPNPSFQRTASGGR